ncbi:MAG: hypothetical protein Q8Q14_05075 [Gemmatimonadales bacterium]|nr:hypothetical protein [Gemmatimonadales bacterium]
MMPLLAAALMLQQPVDSAAGRPCRVAVDSMGHFAQRTTGSGDTTSHGGGGVLAHCAGTATTIAADSFAHYSAAGRLDLLGNVRIRDVGMSLDARFVQYFLRDERLDAHNNVVAVNPRNGSVLRGPNLRYWRAAPGIRDTVEMYATSRPTVEYRGAGDSANAEPYIIVADRMRFKGEDRMWGGGRVTVDRSDFASRSDSLLLDQTQGIGVLTGARQRPTVEGRGARADDAAAKSYTLTGTRIELGFEDREVRLVKALGDGKATGADWTLTADTIHLLVEQRQLQQTFAWGDSSRPHAISTLYTIQSDSMAIDSPGEVLTESRAFGDAFSTARRDSLTTAAEMDWIAGDTLTARFAQETDSAGAERSRLRQIVSRGGARALTHHPDARDSTIAPAINYSRGNRISVTLTSDRIERVVVAGRADGVHLEAPPPVRADTTAAPAAPAPPPAPPPSPRPRARP